MPYRLAFRFVHGLDLEFGLDLVAGFERHRIAGEIVIGVVATPTSLEFPIPMRHIRFHELEDMASDSPSHPGTRRVRAVQVPDSGRELKPLKNSLKI